ncbi:hypothetical protein HMPREF9699_01386 [Bergeyella zoohelcum ATCC 43767]|uniref:Uncharacterized protein n=1 Tax=Bergeyella zoohelcum ATCC 43767 TaxID=883096 RepID=K1LX41_9FLAO|nr:hypothetical protein HMPREF9699_01386 [Bergeyella zoohelcum ATCC 43767]SUV48435.1 Uncharacterised protein [Bergeyella zoohelcum]
MAIMVCIFILLKLPEFYILSKHFAKVPQTMKFIELLGQKNETRFSAKDELSIFAP